MLAAAPVRQTIRSSAEAHDFIRRFALQVLVFRRVLMESPTTEG